MRKTGARSGFFLTSLHAKDADILMLWPVLTIKKARRTWEGTLTSVFAIWQDGESARASAIDKDCVLSAKGIGRMLTLYDSCTQVVMASVFGTTGI